jgi:H+/Cl- antiporter ClcA
LITKIIGVTLAVSGKLCVGKEGPLAHIGANIGAMVLYIPKMGFEFLRNDEKKRTYVAAGASAGVSVAFGAPIGGALFAYEMSKPNTFWKFSMIWRVFFSCSVANLVLATLTSIRRGETFKFNVSTLKFGEIGDTFSSYRGEDYMLLLPASVLIGVLGGLYGPLFININFRVNAWRKKHVTSKWLKVVEAGFFCFLTTSIFYFLPYFKG